MKRVSYENAGYREKTSRNSSDEFEKLIAIINTLPMKERVVLILRFGLMDGKARSLETVGKELDITCERARQLEAKAYRLAT
ncbi:hypothetical protein IKD98_02415 [Candidatus Saccharibacteria bacterium]|nr:hypothetical protein [Candidatus Saccharibacteria bacterium]